MPSQALLLSWTFLTPCPSTTRQVPPTTPELATVVALHESGLGSSLFARRYWGSRSFFLLLWVLRCFNSPGLPPAPMHSAQAARATPWQVTPFGDLRITGRLAPPRSFSQPRHVLHRFLPPRHPPHTLSSLTVLTRRHLIVCICDKHRIR